MSNISFRPLWFLFIAVSFFFCSCSKDNGTTPAPVVPPPVVSAHPIDPTFGAHYSFKTGTYWVYKDSLSGRMDSFYVSAYDSVVAGGVDEGYTNTYISIHISEKNIDNTAPADSATWVMILNGVDATLLYYRDSNANQTVESQYHLLTYPLGSAISPVAGDTATLATTYSSYVFNSYFYSNVYDYRHTNSTDSTTQNNLTYIKDGFFLTDDAGIIKMTLHHPYHAVSHIWELQRHRIIIH